MYKRINNLAPGYLFNLFAPRTTKYDFRNATKKLMLLKPRNDYLKRSFSYRVALFYGTIFLRKYVHQIPYQSGIVIRFDNHMTSQRGGHSKIREFSYSLRFARHLFDYTRVIYP